MFTLFDSNYCYIILASLVFESPSISNLNSPIWSSWNTLGQDLSLESRLSFHSLLMHLVCNVIFLYLNQFILFFLTPLQIPALFSHLILLKLEVIIMVDSIFVGSCRSPLFFFVPLIIYLLPCNLTLFSPFCLVYDPLYLLFISVDFIGPVLCLCILLGMLSCVLIGP